MKVSEIKNSILTLPGIGKVSASLFARLNIFTIADLLQYYPRDYEDRTQKVSLCNSQIYPKVHTIAKVTNHVWFGYGSMKTLKILITDGTADAELIAFNRPFLAKTLDIGSIIGVTGVFTIKFGQLQSTSFETQKISQEGTLESFSSMKLPDSKIFPIYHLTEGLSSKIIQKTIISALSQYGHGIENEISTKIYHKRNLIDKKDALKLIHIPKTYKDIELARKTLIYEELFKFQTTIADLAFLHRGKLPSINITENQLSLPTFSERDFLHSLSPRQKLLLEQLPFTLTEDQKTIVTMMNYDIDKSFNNNKSSIQDNSHYDSMRTLLQGDVGSGKTLIAFFECLRVIDYGSQCAIMAPTELLAQQHADNAANVLKKLNVQIAFLTSNINANGRKALTKALKKGDIDLIIGTQALFSQSVEYHNLSLIIIDEQHRFGVLQRAALLNKARESTSGILHEPNLLMMSATPIPQTLALTFFGDLDIVTIHSMPVGRKPIITYLIKTGHESNVYEAVLKEIKSGHQAYFVYPAIKSNDDSELKSAENMFAILTKNIFAGIKTAVIHSKISEIEQNSILQDFRLGIIKILFATTVIEVGVDVPNATCMVIQNADHFGLAELHQLRGRVGRSNLQSYCFLIYSNKITKIGIQRLKVIHESTDGFVISEKDLNLRGPGEIKGTTQSGALSFTIADPIRDKQLMIDARTDAFSEFTNNH